MNQPFNFLTKAISGGKDTNNLNDVNSIPPKGNIKDEVADKPHSLIYWITEIIQIIIILFGIILTLVMLPVIPFLWVSYKGFHGKYGIIKLIRENYNIYQL